MIASRERALPTFTSALDEDADLVEGPIAFLGQSGAFGGFVFNAAQNLGIGISHYFNTGYEVDLSVAELVDRRVASPPATPPPTRSPACPGWPPTSRTSSRNWTSTRCFWARRARAPWPWTHWRI